MQNIQDVVDNILQQMRLRGASENTLSQNRWSIYAPIVNFHHENGIDNYSDELLKRLCETQERRYMKGEISRKRYRSFVTAAFRIRSYINTGKVDFSIVKDTKLYKPSENYQKLIDSILNERRFTESHQKKLSIIMRQFFCFFEGRHSCIEEISARDFLKFLPEVAKKNPNNMNCVMRALTFIVQYLNENKLSDIRINLRIFKPQAPPHRMIAPFTQDDIIAMLRAIDSHSKTPKRDSAIILLAFNTGLRCADIRNLLLNNINWKKQELQIVQKKTGMAISVPLNGKTLNAIAEYILNERPHSKDCHVFLRAYSPYIALKSTSPLDYMIDKYCRLAAVKKIEYRSFHSLRRAFGTELAIAEIPITSISQMLGHRDMSADKAYLSFNKSQTALCAADFAEVPITKGIYAPYYYKNSYILGKYRHYFCFGIIHVYAHICPLLRHTYLTTSLSIPLPPLLVSGNYPR